MLVCYLLLSRSISAILQSYLINQTLHYTLIPKEMLQGQIKPRSMCWLQTKEESISCRQSVVSMDFLFFECFVICQRKTRVEQELIPSAWYCANISHSNSSSETRTSNGLLAESYLSTWRPFAACNTFAFSLMRSRMQYSNLLWEIIICWLSW